MDESVYYIQNDYAGDPRQFYFGTKRGYEMQTQSTMNQKSYAKLVVGDNDQLIDERVLEQQRQIERNRGGVYGFDSGFDDKLEDKDMAEVSTAGAFGGTGVYLGARLKSAAHGFGGGGGAGFGGAVAQTDTLNYAAGMPVAAPAAMEMAKSISSPMGGSFRRQLRASGEAGLMRTREEEEPPVVVRNDFRSTVFWQPDIVTDQNGSATVKVKYPDSLTGWKATARAVSAGNQFGMAGDQHPHEATVDSGWKRRDFLWWGIRSPFQRW